MLSSATKTLLALSLVGLALYSMMTFAVMGVLLVVLAAGLLVLGSLFAPGLNNAAKLVGKLAAAAAFLATLLLLVAGTTGGSFHLSDSNAVIAVLLVATWLSGLTAFFWPNSPVADNRG